ncbi:hypothetical protein ACIQNT_14410 [Streptomyces luteogriseus]|uniref:8-oxoguanine DNA glycosylase OGG fold protein n=1 Tax=Streptomyces luteogriseus TaxID=68233 RepID=UPI00380F74D0
MQPPHLPGPPVAGPGVTQLSRGDLFTDAARHGSGSEEEVLRLLWGVLAWGQRPGAPPQMPAYPSRCS